VYTVKEIFYTLQGEGAQAGTPAVFCRFAGCNLWSGREEDRTTATCNFCDTDFVGTNGTLGGKYISADALAYAIADQWPAGAEHRFVVCTGGEPLLQLDATLVDALHQRGFRIAIETNGTQEAPEGIDWICVSPKAGMNFRLTKGDELKLVYPQPGVDPKNYEHLDFGVFFLSPMDSPERLKNTQLAIDYCMQNPRWRLSLQTHKMTGIR
jgi:7-carboxy-7-deazaguanine synthase (Cx14CxxC type)